MSNGNGGGGGSPRVWPQIVDPVAIAVVHGTPCIEKVIGPLETHYEHLPDEQFRFMVSTALDDVMVSTVVFPRTGLRLVQRLCRQNGLRLIQGEMLCGPDQKWPIESVLADVLSQPAPAAANRYIIISVAARIPGCGTCGDCG